jgi:hypothetical protein
MKDRLPSKPGGDRQFVTILATIAENGIDAVSVACELALEANAISDDYVLNALNRFKPQPPTEVLDTPKRHCPQCGGSLKIIAAIEDPPVIAKILTHLHLPARAPPRSPARRLDLFQAA